MRVIAGVAGKDRGRTLPFPPMWERDGQAPERQEHGPRVQGGAWGLGTWEPGYLVLIPACQPAGYDTVLDRRLCTESTCDCSSPTAYVLHHVPFFACACSVPPHQSGPALGATRNTWWPCMVIDHSLPHLLNRSIIQINHACVRLEATSLATRAIGIEGVVDGRWAKTVPPHRSKQPRRDKSPHTLNRSTTLSLSLSLPPSSLRPEPGPGGLCCSMSPPPHTHTHLGCVSTARCDLGTVLLLPITHNRESKVDTRLFASSLLHLARPCSDVLVCPSLGACIVAVHTSM